MEVMIINGELRIVYTDGDWITDGDLKVEENMLVEPKVIWQLREAIRPICDGDIFQVGEPYTHDKETRKPLYQTFHRLDDEKYRYLGYYTYIGLKPAGYSVHS